jgi:hypothetical protein
MLSLLLVLFGVATYADEQPDRQASVVLDEDLWITFYDLPSRRFRAIRTAIVERNNASAARDMSVTANYLSVEADRSSAVFQAPLRDVVDRLSGMGAAVEEVTLEELDALFGRAHWLLAQHYLDLARRARDARQDRNASLYLWATTHHMERAMLWSNVAVTREVHATLEDLRKIASLLQEPQKSARAYKEKPVVRAEQLLRKIGKQIDRRVLLPPIKPNSPEADTKQSKS